MKLRFGRALLLMAAVAATVPARAAVLTSATYNEWLTQVTSPATFDYEGAAVGANVLYNNAGGVSGAGMQVVGITDAIYYLAGVHGTASTQTYYYYGTGAILKATDVTTGTQRLRVNYTGAPTAIGAYVMTANPSAGSIHITVNGTATYTVSTQPSVPTWWGIAGSEPITYAEFRTFTPGGIAMIDRVSRGTTAESPSEIPEPATILLCGSALVAFGLWRRGAARP